MKYAGCGLDCSDDCIFRGGDCLCAVLRPSEVGEKMDLQSIIMLIISALTTIYLFYALLRPEKF
jgi:K+-transporting ATPase KdpF subunit